MQNSNHSNTDNSHDESINIRELVEKYLFYWKWFVFSIFISLVFTFLYLRFTPIEYQISTTILIEDEKKGGLVSELSLFEDLGILEGQTSLENEIELLKSRALMERVIKGLGVNVTYYQKGRIKVSEIYNKEVPVKINFFNKDSIFHKQDTTFIIQIKSGIDY